MIRLEFAIISVVKRNPLFLHEIEWKNNGFLFTTPNIYLFTSRVLYLLRQSQRGHLQRDYLQRDHLQLVNRNVVI